MTEYSEFVESLKRLYEKGQISQEKIVEFRTNNKITNEEMWHILKQE